MEQTGFKGVMRLLSRCSDPNFVGNALVELIIGEEEMINFLRECLSTTGQKETKVNGFIQGILRNIPISNQNLLLKKLMAERETEHIVKLFCCAPFEASTWRLLQECDISIQEKYWVNIQPNFRQFDEAELTVFVDRLLGAGRPQVVLSLVRFALSQIETSQLKRLLKEVSTTAPKEKDYPYIPDIYRISKALAELENRDGVSLDEKVYLEFKFARELVHSEHGLPNLERKIAESPITFVRLLSWVFRRKDGSTDPPEWMIEDFERQQITSAFLMLFTKIKFIPGTSIKGKIDAEYLYRWITEARRLCTRYGRKEIGDEYIGRILSRAPADEDGTKPCIPVCEAMEKVGSKMLGEGFVIGVLSGCGVTSRAMGEGGIQEREIAKRYRNYAKRRGLVYPYVSEVLKNVAKRYEEVAKFHDNEAELNQRV